MSRGLQIALVASLIALTAAVAGLGAYLFLVPPASRGAEQTPDATAAEVKPTPPADPVYFKMDSFVTDLADTDRLRYVDVTVVLALKDSVSADAAKKMEPQIRDMILSQIRRRAAAELAGAAGKARLATLLEEGLSELMKDRLIKVYITNMVVQ